MMIKILVTYASRTGSTAGVAEEIGKTLAENGMHVDVLPMQAVKELTSYHAVIAGNAIRGSKWVSEVMQFLQTHQAESQKRPFAAFMICTTLAIPGSEKYCQGLKALDRNWFSRSRKEKGGFPSSCGDAIISTGTQKFQG